jgi:hypothetical protein
MAPGVVALDARQAGEVLAQLDGYREQAFARREPDLLAQVYEAGPLLDQDRALVTGIVGPGCGLVGVHTNYSAVTVDDRAGDAIAVTVRVTLSPSQVRCADRAGPEAAGAGPSTLHITLSRRGAGYLITQIRA